MIYKKRGIHILFLFILFLLFSVGTLFALSPKAKQIHEKGAKKLKEKAINQASGVKITTPDPIPEKFRKIVGDRFKEDFGEGKFNLVTETTNRYLLYLNFDFSLETECTTLAVRETSKTFRFLKGPPGTFQRIRPPSGKPEPGNPPSNPGDSDQDPGEIEGGPGNYNFYDIPGPGYFPRGMPRNVSEDKWRLVNKYEIYCVEHEDVLLTFYITAEFVIVYKDGVPNLKASRATVRPITENDYEKAADLYGQDHE